MIIAVILVYFDTDYLKLEVFYFQSNKYKNPCIIYNEDEDENSNNNDIIANKEKKSNDVNEDKNSNDVNEDKSSSDISDDETSDNGIKDDEIFETLIPVPGKPSLIYCNVCRKRFVVKNPTLENLSNHLSSIGHRKNKQERNRNNNKTISLSINVSIINFLFLKINDKTLSNYLAPCQSFFFSKKLVKY